jgi:hypothetical protein
MSRKHGERASEAESPHVRPLDRHWFLGCILPAPDDPAAPKYWIYETGGELAVSIGRLLRAESLTDRDYELIRAYFKQWIDSPAWDMNPNQDAAGAAALAALRSGVDRLATASDIHDWLRLADQTGVDPL